MKLPVETRLDIVMFLMGSVIRALMMYMKSTAMYTKSPMSTEQPMTLQYLFCMKKNMGIAIMNASTNIIRRASVFASVVSRDIPCSALTFRTSTASDKKPTTPSRLSTRLITDVTPSISIVISIIRPMGERGISLTSFLFMILRFSFVSYLKYLERNNTSFRNRNIMVSMTALTRKPTQAISVSIIRSLSQYKVRSRSFTEN